MQISNYLKKDHILLDVHFEDKTHVLNFIADFCEKDGIVPPASCLYEKLKEREETMSTGIGGGIGLPHAASHDVIEPCTLIIRPKAPVAFDALDHAPVTIIIALILPESQQIMHVRMLAAVSRLCKNREFMECITSEANPEKLLAKIKQIEAKMAFH